MVAMTCQAAPVQIEGALPNGEPFYFRARFDGVTLDVGKDDPADPSHWSGKEMHPDASYLPAVKGLESFSASRAIREPSLTWSIDLIGRFTQTKSLAIGGDPTSTRTHAHRLCAVEVRQDQSMIDLELPQPRIRRIEVHAGDRSNPGDHGAHESPIIATDQRDRLTGLSWLP